MLFHASEVTRVACLEHSNFLKVTLPRNGPEQSSPGAALRRLEHTVQCEHMARPKRSVP